MAENKAVNLQFPNTDLEELSDEQMESIVGGTNSLSALVNTVSPGGASGTLGTLSLSVRARGTTGGFLLD